MAIGNPASMLHLLLIFFSFGSSSQAITTHVSTEFIAEICNATKNPGFCTTKLDRYKKKASTLHELAMVAILLATAQARLNKDVVDDLLQSEQEPVTKNYLSNCQEDYTVTLGKLRIAYKIASKKDHERMFTLVCEATRMANKCEAGFKKPPAPRPSPLTDYNQNMAWLNDIALRVLEDLTR